MRRGRIRIGCSGWSYAQWRGRFYPADLPQAKWFDHYARTFDTVEINNCFYRAPAVETWEQWRNQAPRGFLYAVKAHRFLTHMKKLRDVGASLDRVIGLARHLQANLGPILYQLPPHWQCNPERLKSFLELLPRDLLHVFEFREPSWHDDRVFSLLEEHRASFCTHDMAGMSVPRLAVGPAAYVRFHGTDPRYAGGYPSAVLRSWAGWLNEQSESGRFCFAYFNNDFEAHAVSDARTLIRLVARVQSSAQ